MEASGCRFCGAPGFPGGEDMERIARSMALEPGERCGEDLYASRVAACSACPDLLQALTCAHCGCFAVIRALYAAKDCPHPAGSRWP